MGAHSPAPSGVHPRDDANLDYVASGAIRARVDTVVEDFRDLLVELLRADARFLIVGAHALGVHGVPRATVDLDVWIDPAPDNARRIWLALAAFGAPLETLQVREDQFDDLRVPYIGRAALIRNKRASGRLKDLADLESLGESG